MNRIVLVAPIVLTATFGHSETPDLQPERAVLVRLDKAWAEAAAAKDIEKTVSFWADDAKVFPSGQPTVVGKEAIRRYVSEGFALPGFAIQWETSDFVVSASGDMAYGVGTNKLTVSGPQGTPLTEYGRGVTVWRKTSGSGWKCVIDIWNAQPAASPAVR